MNLNTSISVSWLFVVWGTSRDPYWYIKPIWFKIIDIEPERRFVNLFDEFSPLCGSSRRLGHTTISSLQPSMLPLTFSTLSQQSLTLREHRWLVRLAAPARGPVPPRRALLHAPGLPLPLPKLLLHLQQYFFVCDLECNRLQLWQSLGSTLLLYKLEKWNIFYWRICTK